MHSLGNNAETHLNLENNNNKVKTSQNVSIVFLVKILHLHILRTTHASSPNYNRST